MEIVITRTYFQDGTNGKLKLKGRLICYTIELPWRDNTSRVSCIPEGKYELRKRYSQRHGWHLEIVGVRHRNHILFHTANYALKELKGCIAPVTKLSGSGIGLKSRQAFTKLLDLVYPLLEQNKKVFLIIKS